MVSLEWNGKMAFQASVPSGHAFTMDAYAEAGGQSLGPTPVEALLSSLAACTGMDVVSILAKKKQVVTSCKIEVSGERTAEGEWPRPFKTINLKHILEGENLDPVAVARAIQLSDEKYCTVMATLRTSPKITSEWCIEAPDSEALKT
jgi:putative redox protein